MSTCNTNYRYYTFRWLSGMLETSSVLNHNMTGIINATELYYMDDWQGIKIGDKVGQADHIHKNNTARI